MDLGIQEIVIIAVIVVVIIVFAKIAGDKRYSRRSGRNGAASKDSSKEA
jgi:hypothetical protein